MVAEIESPHPSSSHIIKQHDGGGDDHADQDAGQNVGRDGDLDAALDGEPDGELNEEPDEGLGGDPACGSWHREHRGTAHIAGATAALSAHWVVVERTD